LRIYILFIFITTNSFKNLDQLN